MATFSTFGSFHSMRAKYSPELKMIRVSSSTSGLVFFLAGSQAVQLRDDLSRAIVEVAQASAKAVEGEPA